jgi:alpha-L-fucosidase
VVRGDFDTPEEQLGRFNNQRAWESCMTLAGHQWSYKPGGKIYPLDECIRMLVSCAVGDGNLLLNVGPRPDGLIEPAQAERLREMGKWLEKYGQSVYGTRGGPFRSGKWGGSTYRGNTVYLHIFQWENDQVKLPALPAKITSHSCLTGGTADVEQSDDGIVITMPADQRDSTDTIVKLELDKPASEIEAR